MRGSFCIVAKEENVITEKGVRAFIMECLLNSPLSKGTVFNVDKKTVEVRLDGDEEQVRAFINDLNAALVRQFGNPVINLTDFKENKELEIPDLMRSSQALMVGQLEKGISVQLSILKVLEELPQKIAGVLK